MAYQIKHKKQTLSDFQKDCHKFTLWYNGKQSEASCYGSCEVFFEDNDIPENTKIEIRQAIWDRIDKNEYRWAAPKGAQDIADAYCAENFH